MKIASKLIGLWLVGRGVTNTTPLTVRLLLFVATVTMFALMAALLGIAFISGAIWLAYILLTNAGFDQSSSILIILASLLAMIASIVMVMKNYWLRSKTIIRNLTTSQTPIKNNLNRIADAFMDGYWSEPVAR